MVLNDAAVRSAKTGIIWDSALKGFGLRVGKQSKTFIVLVASGRRKKLGRYNPPYFTLAHAREQAKKILAEKALGKVIPTHTAFDDARDLFLKDCASRVKPSTLAMYKWNLEHFDFQRKSVGDIKPTEILKVLADLKPSNKEHAFRVGRTFFTWCYQNHLVDRSPMERMEPPPNGKARDRVLTDEELKKVYKLARKLKNPIQRLIWVLIKTGQRVGEIRRLKVEYLAHNAITLPKEITKNGRAHTFPISRATYKTLLAFPRLGDYLFPPARTHVRGKPVAVMAATWNATQDFMAESKTAAWTLHDLRRTFATNLQRLGVRLEVTEALLNHVSGTRSGIVGVYQRHDFFAEMKTAVALWEKKLARL